MARVQKMPTEADRLRENANWWAAPKIWTGRPVFIIGGGRSLHGVDLSSLKGRCVIGCNDAYMLNPPVVVFGDYGWWITHWRERVVDVEKGRNHPGMLAYSGLVVTNCGKGIIKACSRIRVMRRSQNRILVPHQLGWFNNTGAAAVDLALQFGASRIVLLGFDMHLTDGKSNWHENLKDVPNVKIFNRHMAGFRLLAAELKRKAPSVEVLNANPTSAMDVFPKCTLAEGLACE